MKNIYDIRNDKKLLYILPDSNTMIKKFDIQVHTVAIVINLYYEETIEQYMQYLNTIPKEIDVFIISSKQEVLDKVNKLKFRNLSLLKKENRGRDISALLVTFKNFFFRYKYVCFLHDKKANHKRLKEDVDLWIKNLWENTIGTPAYIKSVLQIFSEHENIGLLVPPEPLGDYLFAWYGDAWNGNYNNTVELAQKLKLNCDLNEDKNPLTIGTVFWARTECLQKLYSKNWCYEDFPAEPMPTDGTISHAIERILGYVVQDAEYDVGTVMNTEYAKWELLFAQDRMRQMYHVLDKKLGVHTLYQLSILEEQEDRILRFCKQYEKIYVYGAGTYGRCILQVIRNMGCMPSGFVVGDGRKKEQKFEGLNVYELGELELDNTVGIIIAVDFSLQDEIEKVLIERGIKNYIKGLF